jgi:hypothetical protein
MPLPHFLIIGAMKAGTTTLFRDLAANPAIYFPLDKEPGFLATEEVLTPTGSAAYAGIYCRARPSQVLGDASTTYSKLPDIPGVPKRARHLLGPDVNIIYLVREPVGRAISHHHHLVTLGMTTEGIDAAARCEPSLVDYGRYWMQLEPWLDAFGDERVHVVIFEDYVTRRRQTVDHVCSFLGVESASDLIDPYTVYNKGDDAHVALGPWRRLTESPFYEKLVRPRLSLSTRQALRSVLLRKSPPRPPAPTAETVQYLIEKLEPDAHALSAYLHRERPIWDLARIRTSYQP